MNDKLEHFVKENSGKFDDINPSNELWGKINSQLKAPKIWYKKTAYAISISSVAAALLILLMQSIFYNEKQSSAYNQELAEAETFYENQIEQKRTLLMHLTNNDSNINESVNYDLEELDKVMIELKSDLKDNVANQEVIEAMIQTYRLKLQVLEEMLKYVDPENDEQTIKTQANV